MQNVFINLADHFSPKMIKQNEKQTPRGLQKKSNLTVSFWRTSVVKYTKSIRFNATCKETIRIKVNEKEVALPTKIFNVYTLNAHRCSFNLIFSLLSIFRYLVSENVVGENFRHLAKILTFFPDEKFYLFCKFVIRFQKYSKCSIRRTFVNERPPLNLLLTASRLLMPSQINVHLKIKALNRTFMGGK